MASEQTPLLGARSSEHVNDPNRNLTTRQKIYLVLEGRYGAIGAAYEQLTVVLILASIVAFVIGSLFDPVYNADAEYFDMCGKVCDAIFFGQNPDNGEFHWRTTTLLYPFATSSLV